MRSRPLLALALAVAIVPAAAAATESADDGPTAATPGPDALRERVVDLGLRARAHSTRLGLSPPAVPSPAPDAEVLARQEGRLRQVVSFLAGRGELEAPVDGRPDPPPLPRGRGADLDARIAHQHRRATRLALRLGLERPHSLQLAPGRGGRVAQLARWRAVARWLDARRERIRTGERPLSQRVPYYEEFACIARHESGGRWDISTGNGYYGGLQMDRGFQQTYAPRLYATRGTADNWTAEEQIRAAARAVESRGFTPWPTTARMCGLL